MATLEDLAQAEYERLTLDRMDRAADRAQQVNPRHPGASAGHNDRLIRACLELLRDEDRLDANHMARAEIRAEQNAKMQREVEDERKLDRARTLQPHAWAA